jgi:hypothetical protein
VVCFTCQSFHQFPCLKLLGTLLNLSIIEAPTKEKNTLSRTKSPSSSFPLFFF